jgi:acyl dehydratase
MILKNFSLDDQMRFSKVSGDYNPAHIDPISARRNIFGSVVVHGVHGLIWALDEWVEKLGFNVDIEEIKINFFKPINIDKDILLKEENKKENFSELSLFCDDMLMTRIEIFWKEDNLSIDNKFKDLILPKANPLNPNNEEIQHLKGSFENFLPTNLLKILFPNAYQYISLNYLATLLSSTRVIGMNCPGLNSVFSEINLSKSTSIKNNRFNYYVSSFDDRFNRISMEIDSLGFSGNLIAFKRPEPRKQLGMNQISEYKLSKEFVNQKAVIIGGSRGLGEVTAKLISAGGGKVMISYKEGKKDAMEICNEINSLENIADCFRYDVTNPNIDIEKVLKKWKPTHLYYFATPRIPQTEKESFNKNVYKYLYKYYVDGFLQCISQFKMLGVRKYFYPSTIYIEEKPKNFLEYIEAKKQAEEFCLETCRKDNIDIYFPRLPKMDTDQTLSLVFSKGMNPTPIMLEVLKKFNETVC